MHTHFGSLHNPSRSCTRCGKDLTDAASLEAGIGPICRHLDNALLAKLFPSNVVAAREAIKGFDIAAIDAVVVNTWGKVLAAVVAPDAESRQDWREVVKQIEWILSHHTTHANRANLTGVVSALGYLGLATLWCGGAATGKAQVWFNAGRLFVAGPRNKAARTTLKAIQGCKGGEAKNAKGEDVKFAWHVPAAQHEAFFKAVASHYPNNEGLQAAVDAAKAAPVVAAALGEPAPAAPSVSIKVEGESFKVKSPYNAQFVAGIKALPYKARAWDQVEKVWVCQIGCLSQVKALVQANYGTPAAVVQA